MWLRVWREFLPSVQCFFLWQAGFPTLHLGRKCFILLLFGREGNTSIWNLFSGFKFAFVIMTLYSTDWTYIILNVAFTPLPQLFFLSEFWTLSSVLTERQLEGNNPRNSSVFQGRYLRPGRLFPNLLIFLLSYFISRVIFIVRVETLFLSKRLCSRNWHRMGNLQSLLLHWLMVLVVSMYSSVASYPKKEIKSLY